MADSITVELAEHVANWLRAQACAMQMAVTVNPQDMTRTGNWLNVPVILDAEGDAYDRAMLLQQIEDAWNSDAEGGLHLVLRSAGRVSSKEEDYAELSELMKRQEHILDRIGEREITLEDAERFQIIRQRWEQKLREMEHRYPSLKREVA